MTSLPAVGGYFGAVCVQRLKLWVLWSSQPCLRPQGAGYGRGGAAGAPTRHAGGWVCFSTSDDRAAEAGAEHPVEGY